MRVTHDEIISFTANMKVHSGTHITSQLTGRINSLLVVIGEQSLWRFPICIVQDVVDIVANDQQFEFSRQFHNFSRAL